MRWLTAIVIFLALLGGCEAPEWPTTQPLGKPIPLEDLIEMGDSDV
jgi:hypothetical protein